MNDLAQTQQFGSWEQAVLWLRAQPDQKELVLDAYYDDPLTSAADRYWQSEEWRAIRDYLPATKGSALDVGAGRGIASFALAKDGFAVTALEPDRSPVVGSNAIRTLASASNLSIDVVENVSEKLPFADHSFDVVFARAVLHHADDLFGACREFFRVLKPGGRIVAIREHVISNPNDLPIFLAQHPLHKLYGGENAHALSYYKTALEKAGLTLDHVIAPFDSVINYAPYDLHTLQMELAIRLSRGLPIIKQAITSILAFPPTWALVRQALNLIDRRPGRLYSFIARR